MKQYEFLEHTADVKFKAYGKTLEEAFSNAVIATSAVMTDVKKVKKRIEKIISIQSKTKESLLYDFLEKLLYLSDTESFIASKVKSLKIKKDKEYSLDAALSGDNADGYDVHPYIKAVTYNDMEIKEEKGKVTIQVVHDI